MPMPRQNITVTQSMTTMGPGIYGVVTAGITLTLENWAFWPEADAAVIVKDLTGAGSPNITVNVAGGGTIDGSASIVMNTPSESLSFKPYQFGTSWILV